jgi:hypothetical protein
MFAISIEMNKKNLNNNLNLNVSCTTKLTKCFYLITIMVVGISSCGKAPDTEIIGYNSPKYKGYTSSPTKMQVLQCYFCNYIYLYCVLKTLKNEIKLTCF